jgi:hypothetical protein
MFDAFLMKEAAINLKLFSIAKRISFLSFSVTQGSFNFTQGKFICLLDQITALFKALTST